MANNLNDILQLRFEGNGINPDKVKPSEICDIIIELQNGLNAIIRQTHPEINSDAVLFSLNGIKDESIGILLKPIVENILPDIRNTVVASFISLASGVNIAETHSLPKEAVQTLKKTSNFSKRHGCNGHFNYNGETISTITPTTEIKERKPYIIKSTIKIYGEVIEVGSNVHVKLNDGSKVFVEASKLSSKKLGSYLWDFVGLIGAAKWDAETLKIIEFKLIEIVEYVPQNLPSILSKIRETDSGWDKFNNNDDINNQLFIN